MVWFEYPVFEVNIVLTFHGAVNMLLAALMLAWTLWACRSFRGNGKVQNRHVIWKYAARIFLVQATVNAAIWDVKLATASFVFFATISFFRLNERPSVIIQGFLIILLAGCLSRLVRLT